MTELTIILVIMMILLATGVLLFNKLVAASNHCKEAWSGIDVQLKMRHNLVPSLVNAVKGYALHEQNILNATTTARQHAEATHSNQVAARSNTEVALSNHISQILILAEAYPGLKADELFLDLQNKLVSIEDNIQMARRFYNGCVRNLNIAIQSFPSNIVASIFKFEGAAFFEFKESKDSISISLNN